MRKVDEYSSRGPVCGARLVLPRTRSPHVHAPLPADGAHPHLGCRPVADRPCPAAAHGRARWDGQPGRDCPSSDPRGAHRPNASHWGHLLPRRRSGDDRCVQRRSTGEPFLVLQRPRESRRASRRAAVPSRARRRRSVTPTAMGVGGPRIPRVRLLPRNRSADRSNDSNPPAVGATPETRTVCWPGGADLAPDTLYERVRTGIWPDQSQAA